MREKRGRKEASTKSDAGKPKKFARWFQLIDAAMLSQKRVLLPVKKLRNSSLLSSELHRTLYGFIVFEVVWNCVRGINYLNELQVLLPFYMFYILLAEVFIALHYFGLLCRLIPLWL